MFNAMEKKDPFLEKTLLIEWGGGKKEFDIIRWI